MTKHEPEAMAAAVRSAGLDALAAIDPGAIERAWHAAQGYAARREAPEPPGGEPTHVFRIAPGRSDP